MLFFLKSVLIIFEASLSLMIIEQYVDFTLLMFIKLFWGFGLGGKILIPVAFRLGKGSAYY